MLLRFIFSLGLIGAFEFRAGTSFDANCVSSLCGNELDACENDRGDLSDNRSHCRTLLFCISQVQRTGELGVPASRVTDISACTSGLNFADLTPAAAKLTTCVKDNGCVVGGFTEATVDESPVRTNAPIVKSFDVSCLRESCPNEFNACTMFPVCKAMSECLAIKNGDMNGMPRCTSHLTVLDGAEEQLVKCGTDRRCIAIKSAALINAHGPPSSLFQLAADKPTPVQAAVEPWKQIQEQTKLRLKQLHDKLFKTNERVQQNLKLEKMNLNKIKAFEESQKAHAESAKENLKKTAAKLKKQTKNSSDSPPSSFVEANDPNSSEPTFDEVFDSAITAISDYAKYDKNRDEAETPSFVQQKTKLLDEDLEPIIDADKLDEYFPDPMEDKLNSFLQTGRISDSVAEVNADIESALQRSREQADKSAQSLSDMTAQLRREIQTARPVSLVETSDAYSSRARKNLDNLKKILAQQSNLLNQLGKIN